MIRTECQVFDLQLVISKVLTECGCCPVSCDTLNDIPAAKLTIPSPAHQIEVSIDSDQARMATSTNDSGNFFVQSDLLRSIQTLFLIVSQLAILTITPSVGVSSRINIGGVLVTAAEIDDFALTCRCSDLFG